ncbi:translesion error-prone DNA polymerase V autoproteolytic subunit [Zobellella maritima]|uniref:translesion error-prone DNA polymerase V autoproteolytic subunit n=1 Tax=Zobellella maritima TaxID=2059725 RepID=UPI000E2FFB8C|nr:translesion error-prone DNA polymerase V autoproteolytic subunit [Zobellella maritima]
MDAVTPLGPHQQRSRQPLPLILERAQCGFPSPAQDYVEQAIDLNDLCIKHPAATYLVRAGGESMLNAGIRPGDVLVVDRSLEARHGDVVIAAVNGEMTCKYLALRPRVRLVPANNRFRPIEFADGETLDVFGVVTNVIHAFRRP